MDILLITLAPFFFLLAVFRMFGPLEPPTGSASGDGEFYEEYDED